MEARLTYLAVVLAALLSLGASARTENFIVSADNPQLAQQVARAAEKYRRDLAIEWTGEELQAWSEPCPIQVSAGPTFAASGETSFMFSQGVPFGWRMSIQGPHDRLLDSVLPHEITHTIFATHFGCPLPRWADEGACTTVEHVSERSKHDGFLIHFLTNDRGIAFNKMFAMTEYPADILPLYSQGYSLARFLIEQGGRQKFMKYVGDGLEQRNWTAATRKYYGFKSLSNLQTEWLSWVRQGSPALPQNSQESDLGDVQLVSHTSDSSAEQQQPQQQYESESEQQPDQPASELETIEDTESLADAVPLALAQKEMPSRASPPTRRTTGGWYARQRDQAYAARVAKGEGQQRIKGRRDMVSSARTTEMEGPEQTVIQQSAAAPISDEAIFYTRRPDIPVRPTTHSFIQPRLSRCGF